MHNYPRDTVCTCGAWNPDMKIHGTVCKKEQELLAADEASLLSACYRRHWESHAFVKHAPTPLLNLPAVLILWLVPAVACSPASPPRLTPRWPVDHAGAGAESNRGAATAARARR